PREVGDNPRQAIRVPSARHVAQNLQVDGRLEFIDDVSADLAQISRLRFDRQPVAETGAREIEELCDHPGHPLAAVDDARNDPRVLFVEVPAPEQQAGGHDDRPERVTQVVPEDADEHLPELRHSAEVALALLGLGELDLLLLRSLSRGQIAGDLREAEKLAVPGISDGRDDDVRPEARAVLAYAPAFIFESPDPSRNLQLAFAHARAHVLVAVEPREVLADDFVGLVSLDPLGAEVPGRDDPFRVEHEDRVIADALDEPPELLLSLFENGRGSPLRPLRLLHLLLCPNRRADHLRVRFALVGERRIELSPFAGHALVGGLAFAFDPQALVGLAALRVGRAAHAVGSRMGEVREHVDRLAENGQGTDRLLLGLDGGALLRHYWPSTPLHLHDRQRSLDLPVDLHGNSPVIMPHLRAGPRFTIAPRASS